MSERSDQRERFGDRVASIGVTDLQPAGLEDGWRPTGQQLFDQMTKAEQDEAFGPEVAAAVRSGDVSLADLVVKNPMENEPDFITQASPLDLGIQPEDKT